MVGGNRFLLATTPQSYTLTSDEEMENWQWRMLVTLNFVLGSS